MLVITIEGKEKSGKTMVGLLITEALKLIGCNVEFKDADPPTIVSMGNIGKLMRDMFGTVPIIVQTQRTAREEDR